MSSLRASTSSNSLFSRDLEPCKKHHQANELMMRMRIIASMTQLPRWSDYRIIPNRYSAELEVGENAWPVPCGYPAIIQFGGGRVIRKGVRMAEKASGKTYRGSNRAFSRARYRLCRRIWRPRAEIS